MRSFVCIRECCVDMGAWGGIHLGKAVCATWLHVYKLTLENCRVGLHPIQDFLCDILPIFLLFVLPIICKRVSDSKRWWCKALGSNIRHIRLELRFIKGYSKHEFA